MLEVPHGRYCHGGLRYNEQTRRLQPIQLCPYWHAEEGGAYCSLLQLHSERLDPNNLVWDQVKECNVNMERST